LSRFVDRGAIVAGWIGLGTAVVLVVAFGLVVPIQAVVFVLALPVGLLIGWYANAKSERRRPRMRALANALWAGLLTALTMALFYVLVRFIFIYGDSGYPNYNRTDPTTGQSIPPYCQPGPDCTYQRYLDAGRGAELAAGGVSTSEDFGRFILAEQVQAGVLLFGLTIAGAAIAGTFQALRPAASSVAGSVSEVARG
jgi:hypothetical protein